MKFHKLHIPLSLVILFSCEARHKSRSIQSKSESQIILTGAKAPYVLFVLESRDTLKFSSADICSMLEEGAGEQIKTQGYSTYQSEGILKRVLKNKTTDTLIYQQLSAVDSKQISGILDTWLARELLLKGKTIIGLKDSTTHPTTLKYIFLQDVLGNQHGTFYTEGGKVIYSTIIALGE